MRRLFILACIASAALIVIQVASLFQFYWLSSARATQVILGQGCLRVWAGQPGDFPASFPRRSVSGWTGNAMMWKPELDAAAKLWVVPPPTPSAPAAMARRITGFSLVLPIYLPLLLSVLGTGLCAFVLRRRPAPGHCSACGYDIRGLRERCPECGSVIAWLRALLSRRAPRAAPFAYRDATVACASCTSQPV